jgi:hypothetical protein
MATPAEQSAAMAARRERFATRIRWFEEQFRRGVRVTMRSRLRLAAQLLRDAVVINISRPVTKIKGPQTRGRLGQYQKQGFRVVNRSRPGEYPKADTTRLMRDIFYQMEGQLSAIVGTTLDYGLILEVSPRLQRSFLRRTLNERWPLIERILVQGQGGAASFPSQK